MSPIIFDVDAEATPATMTILFPMPWPALDHLVAVINIREPVSNHREAHVAAMREFHSMSEEAIELIREIAKPLDRAAYGLVPR